MSSTRVRSADHLTNPNDCGARRPNITFSATDSPGTTAGSWCNVATPLRSASRGSRKGPTAPPTVTVPRSGRTTPAMTLISVDLPAPFSPRRACTSPGATRSPTPLSTRASPKDLSIAVASSAAPVVANTLVSMSSNLAVSDSHRAVQPDPFGSWVSSLDADDSSMATTNRARRSGCATRSKRTNALAVERPTRWVDTGLPIIVVTTRGNKSWKDPQDTLDACRARRGVRPRRLAWAARRSTRCGTTTSRSDPNAVLIQDGPEPFGVDVRELDSDERSMWWERAVAAYPPYADYQAKTERRIPVFLARQSQGSSWSAG